MNILIYGAGVIGSFLCHTLCNNDNNVTLLARGKRKAQLEKDGLVIQDYFSKKITCDTPKLIDNLDSSTYYDIIFVPMQYGQMWKVLDTLAMANSPIIVLIGNNMSAYSMEKYILEKTKTPKQILFGFQGTGGNHEVDRTICVSFKGGSMTIGDLHNRLDNSTKSTIEKIFKNSKYRLDFMSNMDAWYKCHLAFILPVVYLSYAMNCNLRKTTSSQRRLLLDATIEAYNLLKSLGYEILPVGDESYYTNGFKKKLTQIMIFAMTKTKLGDLCATNHCRHAVNEMQLLEKDFYKLIDENPKFSMPNWDKLKNSMPSWESLHNTYC